MSHYKKADFFGDFHDRVGADDEIEEVGTNGQVDVENNIDHTVSFPLTGGRRRQERETEYTTIEMGSENGKFDYFEYIYFNIFNINLF